MSKPDADSVKTLKVTACICVYCGKSVAYGPSLTDDAIQAVRDSMMAHDSVCEQNPIRAALAAAEAKLETYDEQHAATIRQLMADVADERKHADALANELAVLAVNTPHNTDYGKKGCDKCAVTALLAAHAARRNAEKEDSNG